jgi:monofunctional chorismate mutase
MDLNSARLEIDKIDKDIVRLLEKRFNVVVEIGKYKKANNIPVYDGSREEAVLIKCKGYLENNSYARAIEEVYKQIMDSSKSLEI